MISHKNPMFPFEVETIRIVTEIQRYILPVKLEKSIQDCLSLLPSMSQSLLWGFVYTHFLGGAVGFLHTGHSL